MQKNILIAVLAFLLTAVLLIGGVYYGQTSKNVTPDVIFHAAKDAAKSKCTDSFTSQKSACDELFLADVAPIDIGNDITGSVYTFKSPSFATGQRIEVMISYGGHVYRADNLSASS
jgi:hypothetical protein